MSKQQRKPTKPGSWRRALGRPALHSVVGLAFALLFTWPILAFDAPLSTWTFMYLGWVCAVAMLFAFSKGHDTPDTEDFDNSPSKDN